VRLEQRSVTGLGDPEEGDDDFDEDDPSPDEEKEKDDDDGEKIFPIDDPERT
jgi:hypothetical protein